MESLELYRDQGIGITGPFIYGLVDPLEPKHIRYVGLAMTSRRPLEHLKFARWDKAKRSYKINWIRKLLADGREPVIVVLEKLLEFTQRPFVCFVEKAYIKALRDTGHRLTNATDGGDGSSGKRSPEFCAAITARQLGTKASEETRRRLSDSHKGHTQNRGRVHSEEQNKAHSLFMRNRNIPDDERQRRIEALRRPEVREKLRIKNLGSKHSEETRAKMCIAQQERRLREAKKCRS